MSMKLLETEVSKAINEKSFGAYASKQIAGKKPHEIRGVGLGLWTAVNNAITTIKYDKASELYGSRKSFQWNGLKSLSFEESQALNNSLQERLAPYHRALITSKKYC